MPESAGRVPCHPAFAKYLAGDVSMHRDDASDILEYAGKNSPSGNYAQDIPPYVLGQAVGRLVYNYFTKEVVVGDCVVMEQDDDTITREFLAGLLGLKL